VLVGAAVVEVVGALVATTDVAVVDVGSGVVPVTAPNVEGDSELLDSATHPPMSTKLAAPTAAANRTTSNATGR
jgi:hypothetical protein